MNFKKIKSYIALIMLATFILPQNILAYSKYIIAGGENIGLEINNKGVIVAGFYEIDNVYLGKDAGLQKGDMIIKVDKTNVANITDFVNAINDSNQRNIKVTYIRNDKVQNTRLKLIVNDNVLKTGLYVKDKVSGIGTLTFIDPNSKFFGTLGHEVIESSTGKVIDVDDGSIYKSKVTSIEKSVRGEPGSKNAKVDNSDIYGTIKENTKKGVFGIYEKQIDKNKLYEVGNFEDIKLGKASIITVINGEEKEEYGINIISVNNELEDNKNILFEITDKKLINKTGGIVQGMSGSPIIQNNKIIGAVTNVVIDNPKKGYGILITSMLEEAEN